MLNKTNTIRLGGGGKSLVKSTTYSIILFSILTISAILSDTVNAARKKTTTSTKRAATSSSKSKSSTKRAATNKASTKRAATTKTSTKRAATSNKSSTKRAATTKASTKRAISRGSTKKAVTTTSTTTSSAKTTVCPVATFLRKTYNEEKAEYIYYSSKTQECTLPEGDIAEVVTWEKAKKDTYDKSLQTRPSWISEAETAFLTCIPGYVEKTVDKVKTCIIASGICPVNDIVEKSGTTYKNPNTQEECVAPEKAVVRNVKGDENLLSYTLADEKAYKFECPANYYPVEDMATSLKVKCEACPTGTSSTKGSSSIADCVGKDDVVEPEPVVEEEAPQPVVSAPQVNEDEAQRLAKLRIKKVEGTEDDYTCIDGWTNNWAVADPTNLYCSDFFRKAFIMDKDGKIKNIVDRNNYGKNKKGCPIKFDNYASVIPDTSSTSLPIIKLQSLSDSYFSSLKCTTNAVNVLSRDIDSKSITDNICPSTSTTKIYSRIGLLKVKMNSSDIDNTGVNGWTEEEYEAWDGYRPIIGAYFNLSLFEGRTMVNSTSLCRENSNAYHLYNYGDDYVSKLKQYSSEKQLFKYWD